MKWDQQLVSWDGSEHELLDVNAAAVLLTVKPSNSSGVGEGRQGAVHPARSPSDALDPALLRQIVEERLDAGDVRARF